MHSLHCAFDHKCFSCHVPHTSQSILFIDIQCFLAKLSSLANPSATTYRGCTSIHPGRSALVHAATTTETGSRKCRRRDRMFWNVQSGRTALTYCPRQSSSLEAGNLGCGNPRRSCPGEPWLPLPFQLSYLARDVSAGMLGPEASVCMTQVAPVFPIFVNPVCDPLTTRTSLLQGIDLFA